MVEFDTTDVRRYYDRHTDNFVNYGPGGRVGALHRAVWAPEVESPDEAFRYVENQLLKHLRTLPSEPEPHIIDLGCGVGASLCYLASQLRIRGTGLTLSPVQVQHAEQRIHAAGLLDQIRCIEADYCALPEDIPPADMAYAIESFVHGPDPKRFLQACAQIIRPGGLLMICDDFSRPVTGTAATRAVARFRKGWHLNTLICPDELVQMAEQAGFVHLSTDDLTRHLRIGSARDRVASLFIEICRWLPLERTRFGHLVGGTALQTCLANGWIGYDLALFRRSP